jgi:hypothetical protein
MKSQSQFLPAATSTTNFGYYLSTSEMNSPLSSSDSIAQGGSTNPFTHRTILVQPGPLNVPRAEQNKRSFRLIDFGGSCRPGTGFGMSSASWEERRKCEEESIVDLLEL